MSQADLERKKPGPKPMGVAKVVYYRRVLPEVVAQLDAVLGMTERTPGTTEVSELRRLLEQERKEKFAVMEVVAAIEKRAPVSADAGQVKALLNDVERLEAEVVDLKARLDRCSRASDDQKTHWWMKKHDELLAEMQRRLGSAEYGQ